MRLLPTAAAAGDTQPAAAPAEDAPPRRTSLTAASGSSPAARKRQAEPAPVQPAKRPAAGQQQLEAPPLSLTSLTLAQLADVLHTSYSYSPATSSWMLAPLRSLARQLHGKVADKSVQVAALLPYINMLLEQWSHPSIAPATALGYCTQVVKLLALPEVSRLLSQPALQQLTQELAAARDRFDAANQAADSRAPALRPVKAAAASMPAAAVAPPAMSFQPAPPAPPAAPTAAASGGMQGQLTALPLQQQASASVPAAAAASLLPQLRMLATQLLGPSYDVSNAPLASLLPLLPAMMTAQRTRQGSAAGRRCGPEACTPESHMASRLPEQAAGALAGIGAHGRVTPTAAASSTGSEVAAVATDSDGGASPDEVTLKLQQQDGEEEAAAALLELAGAAAAVRTAEETPEAPRACHTIEALQARLTAHYGYTPQTAQNLLTVFRQAAQLQGSHSTGSFGGLGLRPLVPHLQALPQLWVTRVQAADLKAVTAAGYANRLHTLLSLREVAALFDGAGVELEALRESVAQARACFKNSCSNNGGAAA